MRFKPVALGDRSPVVDAGAAQGIDAHADLRAANGVHVDHIAQIVNISVEIVVPVRGGGAKGSLKGILFTPRSPFSRNSLAFASIQSVTVAFGRAAIGRIVFESAVMGRIVRRGDDDAVGKPGLASAVVGQNRMGDQQGSEYIRRPPRT